MPDPYSHATVSAIVLAAGLSTRMGGHPKPLLPLGDGTVIDLILAVLGECPVQDTIVVTGHQHHALELHLSRYPVRTAYNPQYASGEMLTSLQVGLRSAATPVDAALIVLGDQPALARGVVESVIAAYRAGRGSVIIPSYQMRRGHPLLVDRKHWKAILDLGDGQTLRDFMSSARSEIYHVEVDTPGILRDMDTPDEYRRELADYANRQAPVQAYI